MGIEHSGLSGIRAATTDLSTTGNNVANAGTVGFKGSSVEFADIISGQVGGGVSVSAVRQSFTQGSILGTGNDWDLAVSGRGFFKVSDSSGQANTTKDSYYTRNGAFSMDKSGYVVNSRGMRLHMYPAAGTGNNISYPISTNTQEILLPQEDSKAQTTTLATTSYNLDAGKTARATGTVTGAAVGTVTGAATTANDGSANYAVTINGVTVTVEAASLADGSGENAANRDANLLAVKNAINAANITGVTATLVDSATAGADTMKLSATGVDVVIADADAADTALSGLSNGTTAATVANAVNPSSSTSYDHSVALVSYDTLGEKHTVNTYFQKTKNGVWDVYTQRVSTDSTYPTDATTATLSGRMEFDGSGVLKKLTSANTTNGTLDSVVYDTSTGVNISKKININTGYTNPATIGNNGWFEVDFEGTSQFAGDFRIINIGQDGYASGALTSVNINESGVIQANYTNGNAVDVGKIALMAFNNPAGLKQSGGVLWAKTSDSGDPRPGAPGESIYGRIKSQSLESSTVDVTEELVNLITAQRNFQANAKMISAGQEMNQVVLNI